MITKIFFTMLVIIVVGMIFKSQNQGKATTPESKKTPGQKSDETASLAPKTVAYLLIGLLIVVSGAVGYFSWSDSNQVVSLRVINAGGTLSEYQAYRKDISGREFTSIDGIYIRLADTDRLEMLIKE
ncbi:MAG: hypothetical protein GY726_15175 [Proteobacteria bacterium]|nr:hypothetical protein [Pseudomonadota bacterium]